MLSPKKKRYVKIITLLIFIALVVPAIKLLKTYFEVEGKDFSLEINSENQTLVKYLYQQDQSVETHFSNMVHQPGKEGKVAWSSNKIFLNQFENYLDEVNAGYGIIDDTPIKTNLFLRGKNDNANANFSARRELLSTKSENINIVSSLKKFKVIQSFSDSQQPITEDEEIVLNFDRQEKTSSHNKTYLKSYVDDSLINHYKRPVTTFLSATINRFYTSPPPNKNKKNSLKNLNSLKLILDKDSYYRFEIIRLNLITDRRINLSDLKIYVRRGKYLIPNVGGRHDAFFKYKSQTIYSSLSLGYSPSPGEYMMVIKSASNPNWEGIVKPFLLKRRIPPKIKKGFSVVNWEYGTYIKKFQFIGPDLRLGNYQNILNWTKYMEMDALWILAGQTTGWDKNVSPSTPWGSRSTERTLELLAPGVAQNNIKVGAYIMSYFTPANGKKEAGYAPSLGYDSKRKKLEDSLHISLIDEKRLNDIIALATKFQQNPNVHFIGLDFIRTGRADGYEMGPQVVEDMNIATPRGYERLSISEKIRWFASKVENLKNQNIVTKWRWWRAHRVATIVNTVIRKAKITKPLWVFTLGWQHGKQHGQDPYMFFDAGVFVDAVMLYEANRIQFRTMMIQWPNYMRDSFNNVVIGNAADIRFLDNQIGNYGAEYIYRSKKAYRSIYKKSMAKGLFLHDLSRAFWSSKKGFHISEWAILHGHATSAFRQEQKLIPYRGTIIFNQDFESGKIIVKNTSDRDLKNLKVVYSRTLSWFKISDNIPSSFSLKAGQKAEFFFQAIAKPEMSNKSPILGYYIDHPSYPKYFFLTFKNQQKQKELLTYTR